MTKNLTRPIVTFLLEGTPFFFGLGPRFWSPFLNSSSTSSIAPNGGLVCTLLSSCYYLPSACDQLRNPSVVIFLSISIHVLTQAIIFTFYSPCALLEYLCLKQFDSRRAQGERSIIFEPYAARKGPTP